jgi:hypothetical protein
MWKGRRKTNALACTFAQLRKSANMTGDSTGADLPRIFKKDKNETDEME